MESLDMTEEPFQPKESFHSWEEQTAFESKVQPARKWIIEAACSVGYEESTIMVERDPDAVTLCLTALRPCDLTMHFSRKAIEEIAANNEITREKVVEALRKSLTR